MRYLPLAISLVSTLGLGAGAALAQQVGQAGDSPAPGGGQAEPSPSDLLRQYDTDSSMSLSQEEFRRLYEDRVTIMGQADEPTPQPQPEERVAADLFVVLDLDEDMQLSEGELGRTIALIAQTRRANQAAQAGGDEQSTQSAEPGQDAAQIGQTGEATTDPALTPEDSDELSTPGANDAQLDTQSAQDVAGGD